MSRQEETPTSSSADSSADAVRIAYLERLDTAMADLPHALALELRAGVSEELIGLDADALECRIAEFGDPVDVARAAAEEAGGSMPVAHPASAAQALDPAPLPYLVDTRGFAITAALVFAAGSPLIPLAGWVVGVGLITSSRFWYRWEKALAVLGSLAISAVITATLALFISASTGGSDTASNPLMPSGYDLVASGLAFTGILSLIGGLWLLARLRGRSEPVTRSRLDRRVGPYRAG